MVVLLRGLTFTLVLSTETHTCLTLRRTYPDTQKMVWI